MARDDFNKDTRENLARRVGYKCSNPNCTQLTSGPQVDPRKAIVIGVASHITAASVGGPRYNPSLTADQRKSSQNGIWLCQNCAKLIDNDQYRYPTSLLVRWKQFSEYAALMEIERRNSQPRGNLSSSQSNGVAYVEHHHIHHVVNSGRSTQSKAGQAKTQRRAIQRPPNTENIEAKLFYWIIKPINDWFFVISLIVGIPTACSILFFTTLNAFFLVPVSGLVSIGICSILFVISFLGFYSKISSSGFYSHLPAVERRKIKNSFQRIEWGNPICGFYMYWAIEFILIVDKRKAEKIAKHLDYYLSL